MLLEMLKYVYFSTESKILALFWRHYLLHKIQKKTYFQSNELEKLRIAIKIVALYEKKKIFVNDFISCMFIIHKISTMNSYPGGYYFSKMQTVESLSLNFWEWYLFYYYYLFTAFKKWHFSSEAHSFSWFLLQLENWKNGNGKGQNGNQFLTIHHFYFPFLGLHKFKQTTSILSLLKDVWIIY